MGSSSCAMSRSKALRSLVRRRSPTANRRDLHRALVRLLAPAGGAIVENDEPAPGTVFTDSRKLWKGRDRSLVLIERDAKRVLLVRLKTRRGRFHLTAGSDRREDWFNPRKILEVGDYLQSATTTVKSRRLRGREIKEGRRPEAGRGAGYSLPVFFATTSSNSPTCSAKHVGQMPWLKRTAVWLEM